MWGSWTLPYDRPIVFIADGPEQVEAAFRGLASVGIDDVRGYLRGGIEAWEGAGYDVDTLAFVSPGELWRRLQGGDFINVLDVRGNAEWQAGHISGATHVIAGYVQDHLDEVPPSNHPLAIVCNTGFQSTVVAAVLARNGYKDMINVTGGMTAWRDSKLPLRPFEAQPVG